MYIICLQAFQPPKCILSQKFPRGRQRRSKKIRMLHQGKASLQRGLSFLFVTEIFLIVMSLGLVAN